MIIVKPTIVPRGDLGTETILTASNVLEDDYADWAAGTYNAGDRVIFDHAIYEALTTTTDQPDVGALASTPTWIFVSADNRFKMFDATVGSGTVNSGSIDVKIEPGVACTAVVGLNVIGATAQLIVKDAGANVIYDETIDLADFSAISSYWTYFFAPIGEYGQTEIAFLDIPAYINAEYNFIVDAGTGDASCGELIIGEQFDLAVTNFGTSVGIKDFSVKETDDFGNVRIVQRPYSKRADYDVTVETQDVGYFTNFLAGIRSTPVVYIGDPNRSETIVYGYYRDFTVVLSSPSISECSLTVEGLI